MLTDFEPESEDQARASDILAEALAEAMNSLWEFESLTDHLWGVFPPGESPDVERVQHGKIRFTDISLSVMQYVDESVQLTFFIDNPLDELNPVAYVCWLYCFDPEGDVEAPEGEVPTLQFAIGPEPAAEEAVLENKALHRAISEFNDYIGQGLIDDLSGCIDVSNGGIEAREGVQITTPLTEQSLRRLYFNFITCVASAA